MPIDLTPIPSSSNTGGMNKAKLRELTRFYIDKYDDSWIADSDATRFDIDDALDLALKRWYEATLCSRATYTLAAVSGQSVYARSAFPTGASRIFDLYLVTFDGSTLIPTSVENLNSLNQNWRTATSATPRYWMPWNDTDIRLYPTPSTTDNIIIEGFQLPDYTYFDADTDEPPGVNIADHDALTLYAAMLVTIGEPTDENAARQSTLYTLWTSKLAKARARVSGKKNVKTIMGRRLDRSRSKWNCDETITMA